MSNALKILALTLSFSPVLEAKAPPHDKCENCACVACGCDRGNTCHCDQCPD